MDNKTNSETLRKIAKIKKKAEKLRDDVKRLHEKIVQIKAESWFLVWITEWAPPFFITRINQF